MCPFSITSVVSPLRNMRGIKLVRKFAKIIMPGIEYRSISGYQEVIRNSLIMGVANYL